MFTWLFNAIASLLGLWTKLPESTKDKIIDATVEAFEAVFRAFFKSQKGGASNG